jgi:hypothetical protein
MSRQHTAKREAERAATGLFHCYCCHRKRPLAERAGRAGVLVRCVECEAKRKPPTPPVIAPGAPLRRTVELLDGPNDWRTQPIRPKQRR